MNRLLWKILLSRQGRWQFVIAGAGFCTGLFILLIAAQMRADLNMIFLEEEKREKQSAYILINKSVTLLNTFDKSVSAFSEKEIDSLLKQDFIIDAGKFQTNRFSISANLAMQLGFNTDLFFEAVPDTFIDNRPAEFAWDSSKNFIPVIVSSEFLNLYNFGYAMTQGLPQLPPDAIKMFPFDVTIKGNNKQQHFSARVVAFSDRIPSVLVPWDFMNWANNTFADGSKPPSRLILEVKDTGDERLKKFLDDNKYVANAEKLQAEKAGSLLKLFVTLTGVIGLLFVFLSLIIFLLNFQLVISRAKQEIDILLNIGYTRQSISDVLTLQFSIILILVLAVSLAAHFMAVKQLHLLFSNYGFEMRMLITEPLALGAGISLLMLAVNALTVRFSMR